MALSKSAVRHGLHLCDSFGDCQVLDRGLRGFPAHGARKWSGKETLGHNDHMQGKGASPRPACGIRRGFLGHTSLHA
jgi:hypothetical protein